VKNNERVLVNVNGPLTGKLSENAEKIHLHQRPSILQAIEEASRFRAPFVRSLGLDTNVEETLVDKFNTLQNGDILYSTVASLFYSESPNDKSKAFQLAILYNKELTDYITFVEANKNNKNIYIVNRDIPEDFKKFVESTSEARKKLLEDQRAAPPKFNRRNVNDENNAKRKQRVAHEIQLAKNAQAEANWAKRTGEEVVEQEFVPEAKAVENARVKNGAGRFTRRYKKSKRTRRNHCFPSRR
jgi:hypothetical protein